MGFCETRASGRPRTPIGRQEEKALAIYSLNHRSIGKSTHAPGTAGAHIDYITRDSAARVVLAERMPEQRREAHAWLDQAEATDRKNGRVCDKVMLALPRELSPEERAELVRDFARQVGQGKAPWIAAIHDKGKDAENPHAHLVIRDKDPETGKRVACLSEKGSTERLRELWEITANAHLERAGHTARIDRRTLAAQGIDRKAQIHVGPRAKAMVERGVDPVTKTRTDHRGRLIHYLQIESVGSKTRTRAGYNSVIINFNEQKVKNEARKWDLSHWEKAVEKARKSGFASEVEKAEIGLQVAKEFVEARKPLPHFGARIAEIRDRRWNALEADRMAVERAQQEKARKADAERRRAQQAKKTALADRYEARWRIAEKTAKAAKGAEWQKSQLEQAHPWRARLHKIGLKFGPLAEIEGRIEAAQKAGEVLLADTEGRSAWKERRAVLEAKKQAEAQKIQAERQAALRKEAQKQQSAKPRHEQAQVKVPKKEQDPGFGMGF
jgi:hypothetical protein